MFTGCRTYNVYAVRSSENFPRKNLFNTGTYTVCLLWSRAWIDCAARSSDNFQRKIFVVKKHYVFYEVGIDVLIQSGHLINFRKALSHMFRPFRLSGRSITCCCTVFFWTYSGADKSLAWPSSQSILFDGKNISLDASLVIRVYLNSTNIPPIMFINRIYENQNLLSL